MVPLEATYRRSPVFVQNAMASAYGYRARRLRYGGQFRRYAEELDEAQWWPLERILESQNMRLRGLVDFCYQEVPYYQDLFRRHGVDPRRIRTPSDLTQLPLLDKEIVRRQRKRFRPRRLDQKLIVQMTGGTTGKPLEYYATPAALQYNYATYEVRFRNWAGVRFGERMASFNGKTIVPIDSARPPFWRRNLAFNQLYFSAYHMSERNLPHYVERLRSFQPAVIVAYVSAIHALARFVLERGLQGVINPKAVLVSSETLFDWVRADIAEAFGCRVFDGYGLGEMVAFASECERGRLHVSPEYGVMEDLNLAGATELVATGLFNHAMPLLRYRTGDLVEVGNGETCSCGRSLPTLKRIVGRVDDVVLTPEGTRVGPAALSLAFQSVPNLKEAQIHQSSTSAITVHASVSERYGSDDEEFLLRELRKRLGLRIDIRVERVLEIRRTSAGKQRLIVSEAL